MEAAEALLLPGPLLPASSTTLIGPPSSLPLPEYAWAVAGWPPELMLVTELAAPPPPELLVLEAEAPLAAPSSWSSWSSWPLHSTAPLKRSPQLQRGL
jgi:hypothetical protein